MQIPFEARALGPSTLPRIPRLIAHYFPPAAVCSELVRTFFQTAARALASKPALK